MATSFHQWESDPLFSAAEVVQDSADRFVCSLLIYVYLPRKPREKVNKRNKVKIFSGLLC